MKILHDRNILALSKLIYKTDIMPTGDSRSFIKLSKKLILCLQEGYEFRKLKRVVESDLVVTYGLSVNELEAEEIAELVWAWFND